MTGIRHIMEANRLAGQHFFSPDTMKCWNSQTHGTPKDAEFDSSLTFFITSERYPNCRRHFAIRLFYGETGGVGSGSGAHFSTLRKAQRAMEHFARGEWSEGYKYASPGGNFWWMEDWSRPDRYALGLAN